MGQPRPGRKPREPGADSGEDTDDSAIGEVEAAIRRQRKQVGVKGVGAWVLVLRGLWGWRWGRRCGWRAHLTKAKWR